MQLTFRVSISQAILVSAVVLCGLVGTLFLHHSARLARDFDERIHSLQKEADLLFDSATVRVISWLSQQRWLGPLRPVALQPHFAACTQPSTAVLFVPLFGRPLADRRYLEYVSCMQHVMQQARWAVSALWCTVAVVSLSLLLVSVNLWRRFLAHLQGSGRVSDDEEFLRRRVPFLTQQQMDTLEVVEGLGHGAFGAVTLVKYEGAWAAHKRLLVDSAVRDMLEEARCMVHLDGAGGMPRVLALCLAPPMMLMEFVGHTYDKYLCVCSVGGFLDSVAALAGCLGEIHAKGVVHNDLKMDNVTFSGGKDRPVFHVIDCGLSCNVGAVVGPFVSCESDYDPEGDKSLSDGSILHVAPEVLRGRPSTPASDVHSLGVLVKDAKCYSVHRFVRRFIRWLAAWCTQRRPSRRPGISQVKDAVRHYRGKLAKEYSDASFAGHSP